MPLAEVAIPDEHKWYVSPWEVIIPVRHARHMSAMEIGNMVLSLIPRIRRLESSMPDWGPLQSIEALELWVSRMELKHTELEEAREKASKLRQGIQVDYDRFFITIGRRDGFHCQHCHATKEIEIDHVIAVTKGGTNEPTNLQLLCKTCNIKKGNKA